MMHEDDEDPGTDGAGKGFEPNTEPVEPGGGEEGKAQRAEIATRDAGDKDEKQAQAEELYSTRHVQSDVPNVRAGVTPVEDLPEHLDTVGDGGPSFHKKNRQGISAGTRTVDGRPHLMHKPITPDAKPRTASPREAIPQTPWGAASDPTRKKEEKVVKAGETAG